MKNFFLYCIQPAIKKFVMFLNMPVEKKNIFGINTVQQLGYMATDPKKKLLSFSQL